MRSLEAAMLDEAAPDDQQDASMRQDALAKILGVEAGITDAPTIQIIADGLPRFDPQTPWGDRELDELAGLLRTQLEI